MEASITLKARSNAVRSRINDYLARHPKLRTAARIAKSQAGISIFSPLFGGHPALPLSLISASLLANYSSRQSGEISGPPSLPKKLLKSAAFVLVVILALAGETQAVKGLFFSTLILMSTAKMRGAGKQGGK
ncbi:hypothetical protein ACFL5U_02320 [Candidatus Margulisiibacteriota bacterium]